MQHMTQGAFVQLQATCFTLARDFGDQQVFLLLMQRFLMLARAQDWPKTHKKLTAFHLKTKVHLYFMLVFKQELKDSINNKQDNMISQLEQCQNRECQCVGSSPGSISIMQRWLMQSVQLL